MNSGDVHIHKGCRVVDSHNDLSIQVECPGHDTALEDVRPEFVSPLYWRPKPGDMVTLYERIPSTRPDAGVTWAGWTHRTGDTSLLPDWLAPGKVHLVSEEGGVSIALEDRPDPDSAQGPGNLPAARFGRHDADSPLVCGTEHKALLEGIIDTVKGLADAVQAMATALATHTHAVSGAATLAPADAANYTNAASSAGNASSALTTKKSQIPDTLSDYAFTSKEPG
ncbi:MAG: hypothetical protein AB7U23_13250 [Dehalococcoidia bacterium]